MERAQTQRRPPPLPHRKERPRGPARPSRRSALGEQGPGVLVDPKGELDGTEDPLAAAEREFTEELGHGAPPGERVGLGEIVQASGKAVSAWAVAGDLDASRIESNDFEMEWPPRSGGGNRFPRWTGRPGSPWRRPEPRSTPHKPPSSIALSPCENRPATAHYGTDSRSPEPIVRGSTGDPAGRRFVSRLGAVTWVRPPRHAAPGDRGHAHSADHEGSSPVSRWRSRYRAR